MHEAVQIGLYQSPFKRAGSLIVILAVGRPVARIPESFDRRKILRFLGLHFDSGQNRFGVSFDSGFYFVSGS